MSVRLQLKNETDFIMIWNYHLMKFKIIFIPGWGDSLIIVFYLAYFAFFLFMYNVYARNLLF